MDIRLITTGLFAAFSTILSFSTAPGHSLEDLRKDMRQISEPLAKITGALETTQAGPIRAQLHAAQHDMIITHQQAEMKLKCMELQEKIPALERRLQKLEKAGATDKAEQVQLGLDKAKALATVTCPAPCK